MELVDEEKETAAGKDQRNRSQTSDDEVHQQLGQYSVIGRLKEPKITAPTEPTAARRE